MKPIGPLTRRETEVLIQYILRGTLKATAHYMGISIKTIEKHIGKVHRKLNLYGFELLHYAISNRLVAINAYDKNGKRIGYLTPASELLH